MREASGAPGELGMHEGSGTSERHPGGAGVDGEKRDTPLVKICGVTRPADAEAAVRLGADFVGAILSPGFSRTVEPSRARDYPLERPDGGAAGLVAVLVDPTAAEAVRLAEAAGAGVIQLHGEEPPELLAELRRRGPWRLWKAVRAPEGGDLGASLSRYGEVTDGLLVDGRRAGRRGGGHGVRFRWEVVEAERAELRGVTTFVAAGGLTPENVGEAVRRLTPDVVDVSSGVERAVGVKDEARVRSFIRNARNAAGETGS